MKIMVHENKFHGGGVVYSGGSINQAIRTARKISCVDCQCGGPVIVREDGMFLCDWEATPPFQPSNCPSWHFYSGDKCYLQPFFNGPIQW